MQKYLTDFGDELKDWLFAVVPNVGYGFYMLEPCTTSSILVVSVLPVGQAFIARHRLVADKVRHPTGAKWSYSWERWQTFRTDLPASACR
jgi:hypothetical protein